MFPPAPATVCIITDRLESTLELRDGQTLTLPAAGKLVLPNGQRVNVGAGDAVGLEVEERTI